jgi:hypothetical protein
MERAELQREQDIRRLRQRVIRRIYTSGEQNV